MVHLSLILGQFVTTPVGFTWIHLMQKVWFIKHSLQITLKYSKIYQLLRNTKYNSPKLQRNCVKIFWNSKSSLEPERCCLPVNALCGGATPHTCTGGFSLPSGPRITPPVGGSAGWQVSLSQDLSGQLKHLTRILTLAWVIAENLSLLIFNLWYHITFPTF